MKSPRDIIERRRHTLHGAVQGVGFRPFVHRLATERRLSGWVQNNATGVVIEIEGQTEDLTRFETSLRLETPPSAKIERVESSAIAPLGRNGFEILSSADEGEILAAIPLDLAICADCLGEMRDPGNRRFRHPFINCCHCGPRHTIIAALPYDRENTSMARFAICAECRAEYENPASRRFHAQAIACPACGPQLELWDAAGKVLSNRNEALLQAAVAVAGGKILALKGLGGFQLLADAAREETVLLLRQRKHRPAKPLALMYPSLESVRGDCDVSPVEEELLRSAAAPIVLLRHRNPARIARSVAPGNPWLGVMLPCSAVHVLLLEELGRPVVATSGNRSGEPVCIDETDAFKRLGGIADFFLVHDRPILHRADDSVARVAAGRAMTLRPGRGCAPSEIRLNPPANVTVLGTGGHLKNTVALAKGDTLILSPHVGDLDSPEAGAAHKHAVEALLGLRKAVPAFIAHDAHPEYRSTRLAREHTARLVPVQHHYAHALSCMADNGLDAPCLAAVFDGAGYGDDGSIWGGEFLEIDEHHYTRAAHFLEFRLPGGEQAMRHPRRTALGLIETMGHSPERLAFGPSEERLLLEAMRKGVNSPFTSSVGRLFDGVAVLCGLCDENRFEGEAAMALEFAATSSDEIYPCLMEDRRVDWRPMLGQILTDLERDTPVGVISARFHNTLAAMIVMVAQRLSQTRVLLTGGCFQNKLLLETSIARLQDAGFEPNWHRRIPPNDGGLAVGQILGALRQERRSQQN